MCPTGDSIPEANVDHEFLARPAGGVDRPPARSALTWRIGALGMDRRCLHGILRCRRVEPRVPGGAQVWSYRGVDRRLSLGASAAAYPDVADRSPPVAAARAAPGGLPPLGILLRRADEVAGGAAPGVRPTSVRRRRVEA